jgi:hypothetical protein
MMQVRDLCYQDSSRSRRPAWRGGKPSTTDPCRRRARRRNREELPTPLRKRSTPSHMHLMWGQSVSRSSHGAWMRTCSASLPRRPVPPSAQPTHQPCALLWPPPHSRGPGPCQPTRSPRTGGRLLGYWPRAQAPGRLGPCGSHKRRRPRGGRPRRRLTLPLRRHPTPGSSRSRYQAARRPGRRLCGRRQRGGQLCTAVCPRP